MVQVADVSVIEHQMLRLGSTNSVSAWLSAGVVGAVCSGVDSGSDVDADDGAAGSALRVDGLFTTCITIRTRKVRSRIPSTRRAEPAAPSSASTSEPESTPEQTAPTTPADNQALAEFVLPSRNIWCSMTETSATCTIGQFSYAAPTPTTACTGTVGSVFSVTAAEGATLPCVDAVPPRPAGATVLEYGQASTIGELTCSASRNGAACRHNPPGAGFDVAKAGYAVLGRWAPVALCRQVAPFPEAEQ